MQVQQKEPLWEMYNFMCWNSKTNDADLSTSAFILAMFLMSGISISVDDRQQMQSRVIAIMKLLIWL